MDVVKRFDAVRDIRVLGKSCTFCSGIGDGNHDGNCKTNQASHEAFMEKTLGKDWRGILRGDPEKDEL